MDTLPFLRRDAYLPGRFSVIMTVSKIKRSFGRKPKDNGVSLRKKGRQIRYAFTNCRSRNRVIAAAKLNWQDEPKEKKSWLLGFGLVWVYIFH